MKSKGILGLAAGLLLAASRVWADEAPAPFSGFRPAELFHAQGRAVDAAGDSAAGYGLRAVGVGVGHAQNWSPKSDSIIWNQASLLLVFDHDPFFPYQPSPSLLWVVEADAGLTEQPANKAVASAGIHALWSPWRPLGWRPFLSGGIGGIYTDWQVQGQSLRVNFNPQVGLGAEMGERWLLTLRVHHLSNAGLSSPNVGVNSVLGMLALYL
jgi:hypothetical protein